MIINLKNWYQKPLAKDLLESESTVLGGVLPKIFGYYLVQMGGPTNSDSLLSTSPIHNHIVLNVDQPTTNNSLPIRCSLEELPFLPESIDLILMLHVLEFLENPKMVLQEVYNSLIQGGYLIILGFNPYSLWGISKFLNQAKDEIWQGNWISSRKLRSWLGNLNFNLEDYQTFYFHPPSENSKKMTLLETLGKMFYPHGGAGYMLVVQKRSLILTLMQQPEAFLINNQRVIKSPTPRVTSCNHH